MGCDGGTIPKRDELVKTKQKPEQKDKIAEQVFRWQHCALSQEKLNPPIVACKLGRIYNKDKLIEALLNRSCKSDIISHIRSLKDVKVLNLTPNPAYKDHGPDKGDVYVDPNISPYICPVAGLEMNGNYKFCYLWSCGCAFSVRSLQHIPTSTCHKPFNKDDVIILNPNEEEAEKMLENLNCRSQKKRESTSNSLEQVKKSKLSSGQNETSISKCHPSYTVAKDPCCSETYKSIFTSHPSAQKKHEAHWVTYNPFYN